MIRSIGNIFKVPELKKRILITLGLLVIYRIGFHIPLPYINMDVIKEQGERAVGGFGRLLGLLNAFSAGDIAAGAIFSLGIMPYISSSIIFSLLTKVIPSLEKLAKEGSSGQRKINQYTRWATVPICMFQSIIAVRVFFGNYISQGINVVETSVYESFWFIPMAMLALTGGTIFLMWLGEQISEYGIGNGISLLIMAGIVARLPDAVSRLMKNTFVFETYPRTTPPIIFILLIGVIIGVVYITKGQRRIPIQQARLTRGRKVYGGQRHYMPLRVNMAGVMPVIFASTLLIFPSFLVRHLKFPVLERLFSPPGFWWIIFYGGLVYFFSYFWNSLIFQPTEMANNMKEYGSFIPGIRPGRKTAEHLENVIVRITLVGAYFLAVIAIFPQIISEVLNVDYAIASFLGGTSILIVVGVALDLVDKINTHLLIRDYQGFMKRGLSVRG